MNKAILKPRIQGKIDAEEVEIGKGVVVEDGVVIKGKEERARKVVLGDFCFIGYGTRIIVPEFKLGDYSKLHANSFAHGIKPIQIGRNCWIGGNTILDSIGGLDVDDNVGIGAQSQVWTHIKFGDIIEGCRFYTNKYMHIGKDAWFVGHCIVSPVRVGEKSMALAGSVITKDMLPNHIYAGVPAEDVSVKMGFQFEKRTINQKATKLQELIDIFVSKNPSYKGQLVVVKSNDEKQEGVTWFDVSNRTYNKIYSNAEIAFMREYHCLVKFTPEKEPAFFMPQANIEP